jgi:hypothetical protein
MYQYTLRVRAEKYLWGSPGMLFNFDGPMFLVVSNDQFGAPIKLFTETKDGAASRVSFGQLDVGQTYTFALSGLHGVVAQCDLNSDVQCAIVHISGLNQSSQNASSRVATGGGAT